jgi:hypothetical protein
VRTAGALTAAGLALTTVALLTGCGSATHSTVAGSPRSAGADTPVAPASTAAGVTPSSAATVPATAPVSSPTSAAVQPTHRSAGTSATASAASSAAPVRATSPSPGKRRHAEAVAVPSCGLPALRVMALQGGASMGEEYALLTFTNDGSTPCRLSGYPSVSLEHAGAALGGARPAQTAGTGDVTLASGATAQARIRVPTDCAAPESDHVRVGVPESTGSALLPLAVRGCTVHVEAFQPAA